jgi:AraC-like DNA-binding protein
MKYTTLPPPESLKKYVRYFWILEHTGNREAFVHRSMACNCSELIFHYRGHFDELVSDETKTPSFSAGIHFQSTTYRRFETNEGFGIFGAFLYPHTVSALLKFSPGEMLNEMLPLSDWLKQEGRDLEAQMRTAANHQMRYALLCNFLNHKLRRTKPISHPVLDAVLYLSDIRKQIRVSVLAKKLHISERQMERKFREYTGYSPKLFMRLLRFEDVCNAYEQESQNTLSEIAHGMGYADQAHFNREFLAFSGLRPRAFFHNHTNETAWRDAI